MVQGFNHEVIIPRDLQSAPADRPARKCRWSSPRFLDKVCQALPPWTSGERLTKVEDPVPHPAAGTQEHYYTTVPEDAIIVDIKDYMAPARTRATPNFTHLEDALHPTARSPGPSKSPAPPVFDDWRSPVGELTGTPVVHLYGRSSVEPENVRYFAKWIPEPRLSAAAEQEDRGLLLQWIERNCPRNRERSMRQRDLKFTCRWQGNLAFDVVESSELEEALCEPFRLNLKLASDKNAIDFKQVLDCSAPSPSGAGGRRPSGPLRPWHVATSPRAALAFRRTRYELLLEPQLAPGAVLQLADIP